MNFNFNLKTAKALKVWDNFPIFDKTVEVYHTWQLCEMPVAADPGKILWAHQGFSTKGAPDSGVCFEKDQTAKNLLDITLNLDTVIKAKLDAGETVSMRLDVHWWESDHSSEKIRGIFTDTTLKVLSEVFKENSANQTKVTNMINDWVTGNKDILNNAVDALIKAVEQPWVAGAIDFVKCFEIIYQIAINNSDDYMWKETFNCEMVKVEGIYEWRFFPSMEEVPNYQDFSKAFEYNLDNENGDRDIEFEAFYTANIY